MNTRLACIGAVALAVGSVTGVSASAQTIIDVGSAGDNSGGSSYWTASSVFNLPTGFTNATLNIADFFADDRGVVELNGTVIDSVGYYGPGGGSFHFTASDPNNNYTFLNGNGNHVPISITSGFVTGVNTLRFIINDTYSGIYGDFAGGSADGPAGPTSYSFQGNVTYTGAAGVVPEPAAWGMMIVGFAMLGSGLRYRRKAQTVTFA